MIKFTNQRTTTQADDQQLETSKEALITQCLQIATHYARQYKNHLHHSETEDLVSEAMLAITENAEQALSKENPVGWLISIGKYRIIEYISTKDTLITHNHSCKHYTTLSLDAPQGEDSDTTLANTLTSPSPQNQETRDYSILYEAINHLSPTRQQLIMQRFGLAGYGETQPKEMAPTRRDQQRVSKILTNAKRTLASYLETRMEAYA